MEHDEPNIASVRDPGKTGEVIWQFTKAGTVNFACLHPGHYEAGIERRCESGGCQMMHTRRTVLASLSALFARPRLCWSAKPPATPWRSGRTPTAAAAAETG